MKRIERMQENGRRLNGKIIIGIDPAKSKHQAVVLTPEGTTAGRSFSFSVSHTGFFETLPRRTAERTDAHSQVVYAIEVSCSLWQNLAYQLQAQGKDVVLVSPLCATMVANLPRPRLHDGRLLPYRHEGCRTHRPLGPAGQLPRHARAHGPRACPAPPGHLI